MKQLIIDFLSKYCIQVQENEPSAFVELMMDNHKCIEFEGIQYYVPEDNTYDEDETLLQEFIIQTYLL